MIEFWVLLIGLVLPCVILCLVGVGWLIKFLWDIDEEGCLFRPIIKNRCFHHTDNNFVTYILYLTWMTWETKHHSPHCIFYGGAF